MIDELLLSALSFLAGVGARDILDYVRRCRREGKKNGGFAA